MIPFYNDKDDTELIELQKFLMKISRIGDVRPFISNYFKYNLFELFHDNQTELIKRLLEAYSGRIGDNVEIVSEGLRDDFMVEIEGSEKGIGDLERDDVVEAE